MRHRAIKNTGSHQVRRSRVASQTAGQYLRFYAPLVAHWALLLTLECSGLALVSVSTAWAADTSSGDGKVAASHRSYTLDQILSEGLKRSPRLAIVRSEADAMAQMAEAAGRPANPRIELDFAFMPDGPSLGSDWLKLQITQMLMFPGKLQAQRDAAAAMANEAQEMARLTLIDWASDVELQWLEIQYTLHASRLVQVNLDLARKVVQLAVAGYSDGRVVYYDVVRAQAELPRLEVDLAQLEDRLAAQFAQLRELTGLKELSELQAVELPFVELQVGLDQLLAGISQTPAVRMAEAKANSAAAEATGANLEHYPDLGVGVMWMLSNPGGMAGGSTESGLGVGVMMDIPIWQESLQAEEEAAKARLRAAESGVEQARLSGEEGVRREWQALQAARRTAALYRESLIPQALKAMNSAEEKSREGAGLGVLVERKAVLFQFELGYLRALVDYHRSIVGLQRAAGRVISTQAATDDFSADLDQAARTLFSVPKRSPQMSNTAVAEEKPSTQTAPPRRNSGANIRSIPANVDGSRLKAARKQAQGRFAAGAWDVDAALARAFYHNPELLALEELAKSASERFEQVDYLRFLGNSVRDQVLPDAVPGGSGGMGALPSAQGSGTMNAVEGDTAQAPPSQEQYAGQSVALLKSKLVSLDIDLLAAQFRTVARTMLAEVKVMYAELLFQTRQTKALAAHAEASRTNRELALSSLAKGKGMAWEAVMTDMEVQEAEEAATEAKDKQGQTRSALAKLLALDGTSLSGAPKEVTFSRTTPPKVDIKGALERRSELDELDIKIRKMKVLIQLEQTMSLPRLSSGAGATTLRLDGRAAMGPMGPELLPGAVDAVVREMELQVQAMEKDKEAMVQTIRMEVSQALLSLTTALRQRGVFRDRVVPLARKARDSVRTSWSNGEARLTDVIQAEHALLDAQLMQFEAEMSVLVAAARLEEAAAINLW